MKKNILLKNKEYKYKKIYKDNNVQQRVLNHLLKHLKRGGLAMSIVDTNTIVKDI